MKTIVLQSYRPHDVPSWITRCLTSVKDWAESENWEYDFLGDEFLEMAPVWARQRCAQNIYALTDVCRLVWLRRKLDDGYERVIWADADLLVFDPSRLKLRTDLEAAVAHEIFVHATHESKIECVEGKNNSLMAFSASGNFLDDYLGESLKRLEAIRDTAVPRTAIGPDLVRELCASHPHDTLLEIALFTPAQMQEIANGGGPLIKAGLRQGAKRPAAANLCHFVRDSLPTAAREILDAVYGRALDRLVDSQGAILADYARFA